MLQIDWNGCRNIRIEPIRSIKLKQAQRDGQSAGHASRAVVRVESRVVMSGFWEF